ncbi:phosphatidylinositol mannoside acyltransferase [Aestuariimicrobium sp. Y1814]|uniref:phosphatidylinositol mannoside acyltransferase n=1 Tax=Aestuariimicrobium sp. Y1814 TaxID=3418742 RepID=UPI003DA73997
MTTPMGFRLRARAWLLVSRVPWPLWWPLVGVGALVMSVVPNQPTLRWARNFATMTGRTPRRVDVVRGLWSWARNTITSLQLVHWSPADFERRAVMSPDQWQRLSRAMAEGGAVLGLPHSGSWDLAGAWVCRRGMPVSTVAEELVPEEFEVFVRLREALGFSVYGHRDPQVLRNLVDDVHHTKLVCLLADRDFSRRGIPVTWHTGAGPRPASMPPGPAQVALRSGATLFGVACHYEGRRMRLVVSEALAPPAAADTHRERLTSMTQQLCDFFAAEIREHPHDWHMLQPFFDRAP